MDWTLFTIANTAILPFWLLMLLAPGWRVTQFIARWHVGIGHIAALYAVIIVPAIPEFLPLVANPNGPVLLEKLANVRGFTALWLHVLAFDLFVGTWIYTHARERGYNPFIIAPFLMLTLLFGPLGFLAYRVFSIIRK